ncbi:acyl-CoA dehydrogenase family protein [Herbaspirillum sp. B65]|uniref:acyl-CoA dehydrogenase family protein n=1 Tax=Herbaspirillum sp. B65 TaxID=137708 RepID=UPI00034D7125|nr:acyl-CoA dehydrogenase family protein [Herbaspirillum sp. B65]
MDFDLSDEQRMLKDSVERMVRDQYGFEQRSRYLGEPGGFSRAIWAQWADMGLLGLPFDEADGGFGGGPVETMIVMEALGRALAVEPYLATVVLGGGLLRLGGSAGQRATWVPKIADGSTLFAFAHAERQARYRIADVGTSAIAVEGGYVLNGAKCLVLHGDSADQLVVSARVAGARGAPEGIALFLVDARAPGVTRKGYLTQDHLRAADIVLKDVKVSEHDVIGEPGMALPLIERVVDAAIAALCAESVGAMAVAHEQTVEYLKTRQQFGVVIGSFQVLQHRAVDMLVMLEQARSMAMFATMMASDPDPDERCRSIAAAKIQIGRAGRFIGQQAVQLHGGIGVTEECQAGHYFRRLGIIDLMFGDAEHHLAALAQAGGLICTDA